MIQLLRENKFWRQTAPSSQISSRSDRRNFLERESGNQGTIKKYGSWMYSELTISKLGAWQQSVRIAWQRGCQETPTNRGHSGELLSNMAHP
jgi:SRSO17 transposase